MDLYKQGVAESLVDSNDFIIDDLIRGEFDVGVIITSPIMALEWEISLRCWPTLDVSLNGISPDKRLLCISSNFDLLKKEEERR